MFLFLFFGRCKDKWSYEYSHDWHKRYRRPPRCIQGHFGIELAYYNKLLSESVEEIHLIDARA